MGHYQKDPLPSTEEISAVQGGESTINFIHGGESFPEQHTNYHH